MAEPIRFGPFQGMCNVAGKDADPTRPEVILNADNTAQGAIVARHGKDLLHGLPGAHSLWANRDVMLVVSKGILYRFVPGVGLSEVSGIGADGPTFYATVRSDSEQSVYVAAPGMLGRYDLQENLMYSWGIALPPKPTGSLVDGGLEPGEYTVCYTTWEKDRRSGNSPFTTFSVPKGKGIFLSNVGGNEVWITDPNGGELQFLGNVNIITQQPVGGEPIRNLGAAPPVPGISLIWWHFGRMWGFVNNHLVYSVPFDPGLFEPHGFFDLGASGTMIAPVKEGFYVSTTENTYFLSGGDPVKMEMRKVCSGAIRKSLAYASHVPELGSNVPVWLTNDGIVAGNHEGMVVNLTQRKVKLTPSKGDAAAMVREKDGDIQYLASYRRRGSGTGASFGDSATAEVIRNGKVIE